MVDQVVLASLPSSRETASAVGLLSLRRERTCCRVAGSPGARFGVASRKVAFSKSLPLEDGAVLRSSTAMDDAVTQFPAMAARIAASVVAAPAPSSMPDPAPNAPGLRALLLRPGCSRLHATPPLRSAYPGLRPYGLTRNRRSRSVARPNPNTKRRRSRSCARESWAPRHR